MTKTTETEIAILQTQMTDVKSSLEAIKAEQHSNFQVISAKIDALANTPSEIEGIYKRLNSLEKSRGRVWVLNTMSALAGAIMLFLVQYAITH